MYVINVVKNFDMKKLLFLIIILIMLVSCNNKTKNVIQETAKWSSIPVTIDTLTIHGNKHEFIRDMGHRRGGICHSPECWCHQRQLSD
jgi:amino acid permease